MKKLLSIYDAFKCNNEDNEKQSLNNIIKGTKSVLANKIKFKEYIHNYSKTTEKYTFKTPGITEYPVFKKQSCLLIPLKTKRVKYYEDLNAITNEKNDEETPIKQKKLFFFSPKESLYKKKLRHNINMMSKTKIIFKHGLKYLNLIQSRSKKERYNSLFLDFFYKWNNEQTNMNYNETISTNNFYTSRDYIDCSKKESNKDTIEFINNDKYSELKYDDNIIFNSDYSKFINDRIEYIKNNKIENNQIQLESIFNDSSGKEIKLKLESIKIVFKTIKEKNKLYKSYNYNSKMSEKTQEDLKKEKVLYAPLYYAFLLCYKGLKLFKHILVSSITFSEDYETITFNEKAISSVLRALNSNHTIRKDYTFNQKKGNCSPSSPKKTMPIRKTATKNYTNFSTYLYGEKFGSGINSVGSFNSKSNFAENFLHKMRKKEEIFHSNNRNRRMNKIFNNINIMSENNNDKEKQKDAHNSMNNNFNSFNEYIFLWETNKKTFIVSVQMPMIYFKYKTIKNEIVAYCDKYLFLYLYKNNFINWDFYVLNYLFSIKAFRKIILNNYSIHKKLILNEIITKAIDSDKQYQFNNLLTFRNKPIIKSNDKGKHNHNFINENKVYGIDNEDIIINNNKNKIYNILNENNESYIFFFTDKLYNNSIIKLYSYSIVIDYEKLNPKLRWKYFLDFKQMKQLNEITKYESLDSFLPKIIKTDFQNGNLFMDFSLFNEFDIEILGYEKKNIIRLNKTKNKNKTIGVTNTVNSSAATNELCIDIQFPFIKIEKIIIDNDFNEINEINENISGENIIFTENNFDLDINFLQKINNYKINSWSKRILELLTEKGEIANISPTFGKKFFNKNYNSANAAKSGFNSRKFIKSISFNNIPITSKFH